jgi:hypothetical protein
MTTDNVSVTTANPRWDNGNPTTNINNAVASFVAGTTINAAHFNYVINAINQMSGHVHTWTDKYQQATYGNNGDRANYDQTSVTNGPIGGPGGGTNPSAGDVIRASHHNGAKDALDVYRAHAHVTNDKTAA